MTSTPGPYAKRYRTWPPEGFTEPTTEELARVIADAGRISEQPHMLRRMADDRIRRTQEVINWFGGRRDVIRSREMYGYLHSLISEGRKRGIIVPPVGVLRCEICSHASERLWEATPETHPYERNGEPCSAFVCARCWSEDMNDEEED